ncbi:hypothetical protein BD779DRAFT_1524615 [Infundibulicybe gibba]|nr:hypothetical protein BD779DRAFT_1524615 [Infundibulicybe gibba]
MATIYLRGWRDSVVECWGRNITPHRAGLLQRESEKFQASDGRSYKWRVDGRDFRVRPTMLTSRAFEGSLWFHGVAVIHR